MLFTKKTLDLPTAETALPGRADPLPTASHHHVFDRKLQADIPAGFQQAVFGLGCFWGAERAFWNLGGVWLTAVGYAGGITPNPTYEEVCSGRTGHNEVVLVTFDPSVISYESLVKTFLETHDPTQGMRQGNDVGTQYRSGIYTYDDTQAETARRAIATYQQALDAAGHGGHITTEVVPLGDFYYAEDYHQQYLSKNPGGYCGIGGTGVSCPIGLGKTASH